ncbi:16S rRNA (guanine(966)-N(2))-methyltransferase RsmD [uncultured Roseobacter sp.]|uniref:16S rRNA (guanine(966)-N(2))-methyltransferase RsmD n=1 Tax=uncultured Roseobacter sp. TaxID=114847 RepID=UPI0026269A10|nr:16S rRNA (guanine(966)-N(2))-methyltransferase RsmD [uncultured Roseobacter sp.]
MRIIAGTYRGTALASVGKGDRSAHLRPTSDRVRESLFSMLTHHDVISGATVLDLFAGTGALGLEALSRGASHVTFVDDGRAAQKLIRENIVKLRAASATHLLARDARRLPICDARPCDLVFLDPPYGKNLGLGALEAALANGWLDDDAFIVWEESQPMAPPDGFALVDQRRYGDTHITLLSKSSL